MGRMPAAAQEVDEQAIIEQIRADWMERYNAYDRFIYRCEGSLIIPKHSMRVWLEEPTPEEAQRPGPHLFPPEDRVLPYDIIWHVDLANSRFHNETVQNVFDRETLIWHQRHVIEAFDGETLWSGSSETEDRVTLQPSKRTKWFFSYDDRPPFFAHGLFPLTTFQYGDLSKQTAKTVEFKYQGVSVVNGRACHVLELIPEPARSGERHRVYVDTARDSAVLRYEVNLLTDIYEPGTSFQKSTRRWVPTIRTTIRYREQDGFWVPKSWRSEMYDSMNARILDDGQLDYRLVEASEYSDVEVELDPEIPDSLFEQPLESGTIVVDHRGEEHKTFQVAEDGETLVPVSRVELAGSGLWDPWIIGFVVGGISLIAIALVLRVRGRWSSDSTRG